MVMYSKFAYGSQFSREKKQFENPILGCRDIKQKQSQIFFGTPRQVAWQRRVEIAMELATQNIFGLLSCC